MEGLSSEENFVIEKLKENNDKLKYKKLQELCEDKFGGLRLILKKLKSKGIVEYEGDLPDLSSEIILFRSTFF